jgi:hypothetical protein
MDHLAEGFCGGALAPAAMPWHGGLVAHVRRDPEGRQAHKPIMTVSLWRIFQGVLRTFNFCYETGRNG